MFTSFEDKGKIFTDVIRKEPVEVIIQTTTNTLIQGTLHVQLDQRIKDEIDKDEPFVAITNATLFDAEKQAEYTTDFLAVNRTQIVWLFPKRGKEEPGSDA